MIGHFLNLQGQMLPHFFPGVGDVGIAGTVIAVWKTGGGLVRADNNQSVPNSQWDFAPSSDGCSPINFGNPLVLPFGAGRFAVGQRVSFDVIAGPHSAQATNVNAL